MSILKALEKQRAEGSSPVKPIRLKPSAGDNIVPFETSKRAANQPPELLSLPIGSQNSAFMRHGLVSPCKVHINLSLKSSVFIPGSGAVTRR